MRNLCYLYAFLDYNSIGTRRFPIHVSINMATPLLVNYFNGTRVLLKQVLSRHNSLEGKVIFFHSSTLQVLQMSMTFKVCILTENLKHLKLSSSPVQKE